ncbi:MAG: DUF167 domain-containing protein [Acidimicrobiales bacterium]
MTEDLFDVEPVSSQDSDSAGAIVLRLAVQPGAGRSVVTGRRGDALAVRVAPPPLDGRANAAVVELVADLFGVSRSEVELVSGERSRQKRLRVRGVAAERARRVIDAALDEAASAQSRPSRHRRSR